MQPRLREAVEVVRYWLNEPETRADGSANIIRTPTRIIVILLVWSMLEYMRVNAQSFMGDVDATVVNESDVLALLPATDAEPDLDQQIPFHSGHLSAICEAALAKLNLRDQQSYRPEVLQALENIARLTRT